MGEQEKLEELITKRQKVHSKLKQFAPKLEEKPQPVKPEPKPEEFSRGQKKGWLPW